MPSVDFVESIIGASSERGPVVMVNDSWQECVRPEDARKLAELLNERVLDMFVICEEKGG